MPIGVHGLMAVRFQVEPGLYDAAPLLLDCSECLGVGVNIVSIVGARPQFIKLAPVSRALASAGVEHKIIHTGQHYDKNMSDVFFDELGIPAPDIHLEVGSGSHGRQTGDILRKLDAAFEQIAPSGVIVYGDTNSTVAGALGAAKQGIRVAHLEAGLRSFNRNMPEELNRVATDHLSDLCLAPTALAFENLEREGLSERSVVVGDVMADVLFETRKRDTGGLAALDTFSLLGSGYYFATIHRPSNTDDAVRLEQIIRALGNLPLPTLLAAHPRLVAAADRFGIDLAQGNLRLVDPVGYPILINLVDNSLGVVTDSGGLQKECFLLRTPCTTLRADTEWPETLVGNWNRLCYSPDQIHGEVMRDAPVPTSVAPYGNGDAADAAVRVIVERM